MITTIIINNINIIQNIIAKIYFYYLLIVTIRKIPASIFPGFSTNDATKNVHVAQRAETSRTDAQSSILKKVCTLGKQKRALPTPVNKPAKTLTV
jgi:hypothetical protein